MKIPPWIEIEHQRISGMFDRNQLPHALLIHGPAGVGRRLLAASILGHVLGLSDGTLDAAGLSGASIADEALPAHPDFRLVQPAEDKKTVGIEQIRELIGFLTLTSFGHGAKAALVYPAQKMTPAAANGLLKTLEEPAADSYLILVSEALARLPATVVSRCQRIRVSLPEPESALRWLNDVDPAVDWSATLELAGGAPLAALELHRIGFADLAAELARDLAALRRRAVTPASVAKRWARHDQDPCLRWLFVAEATDIRARCSAAGSGTKLNSGNHRLQKADEMLNMEPSFTVLRQIGELRRLQGTGLNPELHLGEILSRWYGRD